MEKPGLTFDNKSHRWVVLFLGGLVLCRLLLLLFAPMCDPSEARYAEMSRVMVPVSYTHLTLPTKRIV